MAWTLIEGRENHAATVSQSVTILASPKKVWTAISDIIGLYWLQDVKKTDPLTKTRGVGASRRITFLDGSQVTEFITGWKENNYLSYVATSGLPLEAYHATLSISLKNSSTRLSWTSFLVGSDKKQFTEFLSFIDKFYAKSLQTLKARLEKA
jgi:hypothetical protein